MTEVSLILISGRGFNLRPEYETVTPEFIPQIRGFPIQLMAHKYDRIFVGLCL